MIPDFKTFIKENRSSGLDLYRIYDYISENYLLDDSKKLNIENNQEYIILSIPINMNGDLMKVYDRLKSDLTAIELHKKFKDIIPDCFNATEQKGYHLISIHFKNTNGHMEELTEEDIIYCLDTIIENVKNPALIKK